MSGGQARPDTLSELANLEILIGGHIHFQTLRCAVRLGVFTHLARKPGLTLADLAPLVGLEAKPARILLLGCTALGLVRKESTRYFNSELAQTHLNADSPKNIIPAIEFQHRIVYRPMSHLLESLQQNRNVGLCEISGTEPTLYERLGHDPELERVFQDGLQSTSRLALQQLVAHVDLSAIKRLLDVGGGDGTALCVLAECLPGLEGTVLETPTVVPLAQARIAEAGYSERVDVITGDCFGGDLPSGYDAIAFIHFMTIWSEAANMSLMKKAFAALAPGGIALVFDGVQANDETGPLRAARWSQYFLALATGQGMFYTANEYAQWMAAAGFVDVRQTPTPMDHAAIVGRKPG